MKDKTKRSLKIIFAGLLLAGLLTGAAAQAKSKPDLNYVLKGISQKEKSIKSIELDFTQEIKFPGLKENNSIIGKLKFKAPNRLRYETYNSRKKNDIKQSFVSNGQKLWIYNIETNQVFIDLWSNWKGIDYFIPGMFNPGGTVKKLKKVYDFKLEGEELGSYVLLLTPKEKIKKTPRIPIEDFKFYLWVSTTDFHPVRSRFVTDSVETLTSVENYRANIKLSDDVFEFKIPKDAEVLRLFKE